MTPSKFLHPEAELTTTLGLARKKISAFRGEALTRGTDWAHEGGEVRYSAAGRAKLLALLAVPPAAPEAGYSAPKAAAEFPSTPPGAPPAVNEPFVPFPAEVAPPPADDRLTVARTYPLNRRIVQARTAAGALVRVRVRDSDHLQPGMTMRCRPVRGDLWEIAQALPRWKGKW